MKQQFKVFIFLLCLFPLGHLSIQSFRGNLSANPIEDITHATGIWTLRFLLITLCIAPLRKFTGWNTLIRYRKMLGLYAFFYGFLHFLTYLWLDQFFDLTEIARDIVERPFIAAGITAFFLMIPLAVTSTDSMVRWLGGKRWKRLHRLVYFSAIAAVVHYFWLVKVDMRGPLIYGALLSFLLIIRLFI